MELQQHNSSCSNASWAGLFFELWIEKHCCANCKNNNRPVSKMPMYLFFLGFMTVAYVCNAHKESGLAGGGNCMRLGAKATQCSTAAKT